MGEIKGDSVSSVFLSCFKMVKIPNKKYSVGETEVTQMLYGEVMKEKPSDIGGVNLPVENVSWYDAIYFCNRLSEKFGFTPVYSVNGTTDVAKWNYTLNERENPEAEVTQNTSANGFRLPTVEEWQYAARGGNGYKYSGCDNLNEVGWYVRNSNDMTHEVAKKKPNGYGLYDMSGNVEEWCWDSHHHNYYGYYRRSCGGSWHGYYVSYSTLYGGYYEDRCEVDDRDDHLAIDGSYYLGFRIVCNASN